MNEAETTKHRKTIDSIKQAVTYADLALRQHEERSHQLAGANNAASAKELAATAKVARKGLDQLGQAARTAIASAPSGDEERREAASKLRDKVGPGAVRRVL